MLRGPAAEVVACTQYALEADMVGLYDVFTPPAAHAVYLRLGFADAYVYHYRVMLPASA